MSDSIEELSQRVESLEATVSILQSMLTSINDVVLKMADSLGGLDRRDDKLQLQINQLREQLLRAGQALGQPQKSG